MSGFRIDVADLLTHSGFRRDVSLSVPLDDLGVGTWRIDGPIDLALTLERIPDGIVVRGTVRATWSAECSICLSEVSRELTLGVDELFEKSPLEGDTYPIDDHELDLEQLTRDALLLELPLAPRCDADCAAPDAVGVTVSDGRAGRTDPRWAALDDLDLEAS
jgi:uncharacterized protein